jgi:tetrahydromethanopterin S-methyltransferase subunit B
MTLIGMCIGLFELSWTDRMTACMMASAIRRYIVSGVILEERVTKLEKLVDELMRKADTSVHKNDWRRTVGMFEGDPILKEIFESHPS